MFIDALATKRAEGVLVKQGNTVKVIHNRSKLSFPSVDYGAFLSHEDVQYANSYPTNLEIITKKDFELIARHGFECTEATLHCYRKDLIKNRK